MAITGSFLLSLLVCAFSTSELLLSKVEGYYSDYSIGNYQVTTGHRHLHHHYQHQQRDHDIKKFEAFKSSMAARRMEETLISPSPSYDSPMVASRAREYHVTLYGADPTGRNDSTEALIKVFANATKPPAGDGRLMAGISNVGGARINLDGGIYLISRPLRFPTTGIGNIVIHGGTLKASNTFPSDGYLIELSTTSPPPSNSATANQDDLSSAPSYNYEYVTLRDLFLDARFRGGGLAVVNCLRTSIDNLYVTHFTTDGVLVRSGHETIIRNSFLGQHITAGGDPQQRSFSGTAIALLGNDNVVSDSVIFSAATGVLVTGQANLLSGVHCYNKATAFGGVGVYLRSPGLAQTRIIGSYLDYTGIVAEDPVQLLVAGNFFLGDAALTLKAVKGVVNGVTVVDNMFSGLGSGKDMMTLDGTFTEVDQVMVERNSVKGMNLKTTSARAHVRGSTGTTWTANFDRVLLFPNMIRHVQYSALMVGNNSGSDGKNVESDGVNIGRVNYVLRNVSENRVVIESDVAVGNTTSVYVMVDQGFGD